jgi:hypothetical protein
VFQKSWDDLGDYPLSFAKKEYALTASKYSGLSLLSLWLRRQQFCIYKTKVDKKIYLLTICLQLSIMVITYISVIKGAYVLLALPAAGGISGKGGNYNAENSKEGHYDDHGMRDGGFHDDACFGCGWLYSWRVF